MFLHDRLFGSPAKSWTLPSYAEDIARLQELEISPPAMLDAPTKFDSRVLKYIDVVAEVDYDLHVSQYQPSDSEEDSMSHGIIQSGFIYVDDEAISE